MSENSLGGLQRWAAVILLALQFAAGCVAYGRLEGRVEGLERDMQLLIRLHSDPAK